MRKKGKTIKRILKPDLRYNNVLVSRFINNVMKNGKKTVAEKIVYKSFDILEKRTGKNPIEVFERALRNVAPLLELKSRRIGGANYQVPIEVRPDRKIILSIRWIIEVVRKKKGKPIAEKLADEFLSAYNGEGEAMRKRVNIHKMAEANRAFAHFAW